MNETIITIRALKYGNTPHYEWQSKLLEQTDKHLFVLSEQGRKLRHHTKGNIFTVPHRTIEFFSGEHWFTVSADIADGGIRQYYCNINEPAKRSGDVVTFVDLDLDLVQQDGVWKVVDEDEFVQNAQRLSYPEKLVQRAREELARLQRRIEERKFPFDGTIERYIEKIGK